MPSHVKTFCLLTIYQLKEFDVDKFDPNARYLCKWKSGGLNNSGSTKPSPCNHQTNIAWNSEFLFDFVVSADGSEDSPSDKLLFFSIESEDGQSLGTTNVDVQELIPNIMDPKQPEKDFGLDITIINSALQKQICRLLCSIKCQGPTYLPLISRVDKEPAVEARETGCNSPATEVTPSCSQSQLSASRCAEAASASNTSWMGSPVSQAQSVSSYNGNDPLVSRVNDVCLRFENRIQRSKTNLLAKKMELERATREKAQILSELETATLKIFRLEGALKQRDEIVSSMKTQMLQKDILLDQIRAKHDLLIIEMNELQSKVQLMEQELDETKNREIISPVDSPSTDVMNLLGIISNMETVIQKVDTDKSDLHHLVMKITQERNSLSDVLDQATKQMKILHHDSAMQNSDECSEHEVVRLIELLKCDLDQKHNTIKLLEDQNSHLAGCLGQFTDIITTLEAKTDLLAEYRNNFSLQIANEDSSIVKQLDTEISELVQQATASKICRSESSSSLCMHPSPFRRRRGSTTSSSCSSISRRSARSVHSITRKKSRRDLKNTYLSEKDTTSILVMAVLMVVLGVVVLLLVLVDLVTQQG